MYLRSGAPSLVGHHNFDLFGTFVSRALVGGGILAVDDVAALADLTVAERAHYAATGIAAYLLVPLVRDGRFAACLALNHRTARPWTETDRNIARQAADRTWTAVERARAEAALAESEELFRSFAENSTDTLWIIDAANGRLDYLSPSFAAMYGENPDQVIADLDRFLDLVHPDDRDRVAEAMPKLFRSEATNQVEYRIRRPSDGAVRWLQDTGFPIRGANGLVKRAGGIVQDVTDRREGEETLRESEAQLQVLVAELHHRTRNLLGVVGTLMRQILASSSSLEDFRVRFTERLKALSRVQGLFASKRGEQIGIGDIVRTELDAVGADLTNDRVRLEGEAVALRKSTVQTLSLAIHELATNALKYGALRGHAGNLAVRWEAYTDEAGRRWLGMQWTETGIDGRVEQEEGPLHRGGYGRKLIEEALPYTLKARTSYALGKNRLDCTIDLPLDH